MRSSGAQTVTKMVLNPTTLSYEHAEAPRFAEIVQCGQGRDSLVVQYTTTNFSFPPTATSFAGELPSEG